MTPPRETKAGWSEASPGSGRKGLIGPALTSLHPATRLMTEYRSVQHAAASERRKMHSERAHAAGSDNHRVRPAATIWSRVESGSAPAGRKGHARCQHGVERREREGLSTYGQERSDCDARNRQSERLGHGSSSLSELHFLTELQLEPTATDVIAARIEHQPAAGDSLRQEPTGFVTNEMQRNSKPGSRVWIRRFPPRPRPCRAQ